MSKQNPQTTVKNGDAVYLTLTGRSKVNGRIFLTSDAEVAKKNGLYNEQASYEPIFLIIGKGALMLGLETRLEGLSVGETHTITVPAKEGFGTRSPKLIENISVKRLRAANIKPVVGNIVRTKERTGIIIALKQGMAQVDFNHELAGKDLEFEVKIESIISEVPKQIEGFVKYHYPGLKDEDKKISYDEKAKHVEIELPLLYLFNQSNNSRSFQLFNDLSQFSKENIKKLDIKYAFNFEEMDKLMQKVNTEAQQEKTSEEILEPTETT